MAIAHVFLAKGVDVNAKDLNGSPALHWAVGGGHGDVVQILLDHGADKTALDANNNDGAAGCAKTWQGRDYFAAELISLVISLTAIPR